MHFRLDWAFPLTVNGFEEVDNLETLWRKFALGRSNTSVFQLSDPFKINLQGNFSHAANVTTEQTNKVINIYYIPKFIVLNTLDMCFENRSKKVKYKLNVAFPLSHLGYPLLECNVNIPFLRYWECSFIAGF